MDNGRSWNHPHFRENGGYVENTVVSRGANNLGYLNMPLRSNNHQPFSPGIHNDRYLHPSTTQAPPIYVQHQHHHHHHHHIPPYDQVRIGGMYEDNRRGAPLKRKAPMAFGGESSSNPQVQPNPQCWPNDLVYSYGRNVRSRHIYPEMGSYETRPLISQTHRNQTPPVDLHSRDVRPIPSSSMEVYGGYHHFNPINPIYGRNSSSALPTHYPTTRPMGLLDLGGQRSSPASYRSIPNHRYGESASTLEDSSRRPGIVNARHSRPTAATIAHSSQRTHPVSYGTNRWMPEAVIVIDPSPFYGSASLFNQHHEIGLDIDNMSYEELLALEERIGNVSTGLCEDAISSCLTEMIHCSDGENGNCVICLEEYEDKDSVWRLKCKHDFHLGCIKKWLMMKNVCPICKASALEEP